MNKRLSISVVQASKTRDTLEHKFEKYGLTTEQRIELLIKAMGISAIAYSKQNATTSEMYDSLLGTFFSGVWKKNYSSFNK